MASNSDTGKIAKIRSAGFFAKGLVYVLIGALTFMAAIGKGGDVASTGGVIQFFLGLPFGKILGGTVAVGLGAYAVWRFYQVIFLPNENQDNGKVKSTFRRIRFFYSGLIYGILAYSFAKPLIQDLSGNENSNSPSDGNSQQQAALGELLSHDWGKWIIWALAIIVGLQALWQFYLAYSGQFMRQVDETPDQQEKYKMIRRSGKFGYCARGVVFGVLSFFLVKVILMHNANAYKGTEGALQYLLSFSYGSFLLAATALGLIGYGIFNIMVARYANLTRIQ